jgi:hypothetical protein
MARWGWHDAGKGEEQQVPYGCTGPLTLAEWPPPWAIARESNHGTSASGLTHLAPASEIETQIPACELQTA